MGKWGDSTKKTQNPNTPTPDTIFFTFMKILIVVDEKEEADICVFGIQHINNELVRNNELNILMNDS
jgi:hypothetical protein